MRRWTLLFAVVSMMLAAPATASAATRPLVTRRSGSPGERVRLPVKIRRKPYRRARRALKQGRKAFLRVKVIATDSSANRSRKYFRIRLVLSRP
jgi:hypothetical protein